MFNINVVPAEAGEIAPAKDKVYKDYDPVPGEAEHEDSESDDEDYMPDLSHRDDYSSDEEDSDEEDEAEYEQVPMATTRIGRAVRPRNRLNLLNANDEKD